MDLGIGAVFQRVLLVPSLTVIENLMLGGHRGEPPERAAAIGRLRELSDLLGVAIDPNALVGRLARRATASGNHACAVAGREGAAFSTSRPRCSRRKACRSRRRMMRAEGKGRRNHFDHPQAAGGLRVRRPDLGAAAGSPRGQIDKAELATDDGATENRQRCRAHVRQGTFGRSGPACSRRSGDASGSQTAMDRNAAPLLQLRGGGNRGAARRMRGARHQLRSVAGRGTRHCRRRRQRSEASRRSARRPADGDAKDESAARGGHHARRRAGAATARHPLRHRRAAWRGDRRAHSPLRPIWCSRRSAPAVLAARHQPLGSHSSTAPASRFCATTSAHPRNSRPVGKLSGGNIQKVLLARELDAEANVAILNKPTYGLDLQNSAPGSRPHRRRRRTRRRGDRDLHRSRRTARDQRPHRRDVPGSPRRHRGE